MPDYKRRNYFIDKGYQGRIILWIIMICSAGLLLDLSIFNFLSYRNIEAMRWRSHISAGTVGEITRTYLIYSSIFAIIFTIAALFIYLRYVRYKSAGPLYRLSKDIENAADGNLAVNIWLRKEDDFKETAYELNRMLASFRSDFKQLGDSLSEASRTIDVLEYVGNKPELAKQKCQQLVECLEPLKKLKQ